MNLLDKWADISTKTKIIVSAVALVITSGYGVFSFATNIWDQLVTEAEAAETQQITLMMIYQLKLDDYRSRLSYLNRLEDRTSDENEEILFLRNQIIHYERLIEKMQCEQLGKKDCQ